MLDDSFREVLGMSQLLFGLSDFETLYPILLFDLSKQSGKLISIPIDIGIKVSFNKW